VLQALDQLRKHDPKVQGYIQKAHAMVVYPTIAKGGFIVGGARGEGEVIEQGKVIGTSVLTQGSIGLQIGGQAYSQVIFFENKEALEKFKEGDAEFAGQASGVAGKTGAGENVDYTRGVAVFSFSAKGLMGEASIGGQSFSFKPLKKD
jgi:lipid-binding SYLF domain-containing protein